MTSWVTQASRIKRESEFGEATLSCSINLGPVWHGSRAKLQGGAGQSMPNTLTPEL
jgi:hypothetical protein